MTDDEIAAMLEQQAELIRPRWISGAGPGFWSYPGRAARAAAVGRLEVIARVLRSRRVASPQGER